jgi:serpin B
MREPTLSLVIRFSAMVAFASIVACGGSNGVAASDDASHGTNGNAVTVSDDASDSANGNAVAASDDASDGGVPFTLDKAQLARDPASSIPANVLAGAVGANNAFALDLYSRATGADAGAGNLITSPLTASLALTMAYAGAVGQTATEMATALHITADASTIFDGQNALSAAIASRGTSSDRQVQIVNSIWGERTYPWATPFLGIMAKSYGTGIYLEDFRNASDPARQAINAWVSSETLGKINDLLPPMSIDSSTRMVLVDALHLKFPWATPFYAFATGMGPFTRPDGTTVSPSFMRETLTLPYHDDGQAQIVALPLAGGQLSVVIALPHEGVSLAAYEQALVATSMALTQPPSTAFVQLSIPKVSFTSQTFSLKDALMAMGMNLAFTLNADFSGLCPNPPDGTLFITDVLQKAMLSMQEGGIEAAAATAVIVDEDAGGVIEAATPVPMVVNRPYLVAIVDVPTGAILALGHIVDPTQAGAP